MSEFQPSRHQTDLAEVVEMLLDKGIVINADIAVSIGDTQLLGVQIRAAIASFETAAKYGLEFPEGTDMRRLAEAVGDPSLAERQRPDPEIDPTRGVNVTPEPGSEGEGGGESGDGDKSDGERQSVTDQSVEAPVADGIAGGTGEEQQANGGEETEPTHPGSRPDPDDPPGEKVDIFAGGPLDTDSEDDSSGSTDSEYDSSGSTDSEDDSSGSGDSNGDKGEDQ